MNNTELINIINIMPGIRYKELQRITKMANGTLSYNIDILEKNGALKIKRDAGATRLYPITMDENTINIISILRDESRLKIVKYLLKKKYATYPELQKVIKKSFSTLTWHLDKMIDAGIISVNNTIGMNEYNIINESLISDIIKKYIDIVNNFIDVWSTL
ncbi:MAG: winged helix-turn-helix transcriptional regulator [Candidatus Nitrosocaldaceae archaeon]